MSGKRALGELSSRSSTSLGVIRRPRPGSVGTIFIDDPIGSLYRSHRNPGSLIVVRAERASMHSYAIHANPVDAILIAEGVIRVA